MKYNVENSDLYDIRVIDNVLYIKLEGYYTSDMDGLIDKVRELIKSEINSDEKFALIFDIQKFVENDYMFIPEDLRKLEKFVKELNNLKRDYAVWIIREKSVQAKILKRSSNKSGFENIDFAKDLKEAWSKIEAYKKRKN